MLFARLKRILKVDRLRPRGPPVRATSSCSQRPPTVSASKRSCYRYQAQILRGRAVSQGCLTHPQSRRYISSRRHRLLQQNRPKTRLHGKSRTADVPGIAPYQDVVLPGRYETPTKQSSCASKSFRNRASLACNPDRGVAPKTTALREQETIATWVLALLVHKARSRPRLTLRAISNRQSR